MKRDNPRRARAGQFLKVLVAAVACVLSLACAHASDPAASLDPNAPGAPGAPDFAFGDGSVFINPDVSSTTGVVVPGCTAHCPDFPADPIIDTKGPTPVPSSAPSLFGGADNFDAGAGPCVMEPELSTSQSPGALFPSNWLEPRFRFRASNGEDLFEIRVQAKNEANELVAYTTSSTWVLPRALWKKLASNALDQPIIVTIRAVKSASPGKPSGTRGTFTIAPVLAGGTMVYWAATSSDVTPTTSKLVGFRVGDEGVVDALTVPQVQTTGIVAEGGRDLRGQYSEADGVPPGHVQCIGCHVSTPDGNAVGFTDHWPWNDVLASVVGTSVGAVPSYLTPGAARLLNQPWMGMMSFSKAHWTTGDRVAITSYSGRQINGQQTTGFSDSWMSNSDKLAWFDVEASATIPWQSGQPDPTNAAIQAAFGKDWGFVNTDGETHATLTPNFSHDGTKIVYTSASASLDGRIGDNAETGIHWVPFNGRQGGTVVPLVGADNEGVSEYYPSFSADDSLIAFNRAASTNGMIYYRPDGEVYVLPAEGGTPTRLAANDPPECTGEHSPGIINSWPKWSPSTVGVGGKHYYWLIFSSARAYPGSFQVPKNQYSPSDTRSSQLYMAGVVRDDATGKLTTYSAVYLWNQGGSSTNLTPAWDEVNIPAVVESVH